MHWAEGAAGQPRGSLQRRESSPCHSPAGSTAPGLVSPRSVYSRHTTCKPWGCEGWRVRVKRGQVCYLETRNSFSGNIRTVRAFLCAAAARFWLQSILCSSKLDPCGNSRVEVEREGRSGSSPGCAGHTLPALLHVPGLAAGSLAPPPALPDGVAQLLLCRDGDDDLARAGRLRPQQGAALTQIRQEGRGVPKASRARAARWLLAAASHRHLPAARGCSSCWGLQEGFSLVPSTARARVGVWPYGSASDVLGLLWPCPLVPRAGEMHSALSACSAVSSLPGTRGLGSVQKEDWKGSMVLEPSVVLGKKKSPLLVLWVEKVVWKWGENCISFFWRREKKERNWKIWKCAGGSWSGLPCPAIAGFGWNKSKAWHCSKVS